MSLVASLGPVLAARAQDRPDRPPAAPAAAKPPVMKLEEAISFAQSHEPTSKAARSRVAAAQATAKIPKSQWLPRLNAAFQILGGTSNNTTASYLGVNGVAVPRVGGTKAITANDLGAQSLEPYPSSMAAISIEQELYDFGRIAAETAALDAMADVEKAQANADEMDVTLGVEEAYFAVQAAKQILTAAQAADTRAKSDADEITEAIKAGARPPSDQARADADVARAAVGTIRANSSLALAQGTLATVIGSAEPRVDATDAPPNAAELPSLNQALADGEANDPALIEARALVKAQHANTAALGSERRPNLILSSSISGRAGGAPLAGEKESIGYGFLPLVPNYDVAVVLSVPLFDGIGKAKEGASKAREQAFADQADVVRQKDVEQVERAYYSADAARAALPALERARDAAQKARDQASAALQAGKGSAVELADAEALLTQSEVDLSVGRFEIARADAALARARGQLHERR